MSLPLSKVIDIDDFSSSELVAYLSEINAHHAPRFGSAADEIVPDAKQWTSAMLLRALDRAGAASAGRMVAGVGAGTDPIIFALARRGVVVFPAERYLMRTRWSDEAPSGMMIDPAPYCHLDFPAGNVVAVYSNALKLNLPSDTFDAVFSIASFERLRSLDRVAVAAREIARILKPGGVAVIAAEFRVDGASDRDGLDDSMILFTQATLATYVVQASGLVLRNPITTCQSDRTFVAGDRNTVFPGLLRSTHGLEETRASGSNLVLYKDGFLFCPLVLMLHKDRPLPPLTGDEMLAAKRAKEEVDAENAALAADLEQYQRTTVAVTATTPAARHDAWLLGEIERLHQEAVALRAAYDRSNAWKQWKVMRPARFVYRRIKRWRAERSPPA